VTTQPYGFPSSPYRVRGLLADGIVFFETPDPLVGEDTNGKGDVYKWSPDGVRLISTGHDASDAVFLDASADGSSVFFVTRERLVATDADSLRDVYVARTDGGFPSRPGSPVPCSGDQCQGRPSRVPDAPVSATTTFTGGGDVAEVGSQHVGARAVSVSKPKVAHGASAVIKVEVLTKGKIGITGSGLRSAQRTAAKAGIYTIKLSLTARARRSLSAKKAFTAKARVTFRPAVGSRTTLTVALTFKTVSTKKGR
jgi:hypothetical protein